MKVILLILGVVLATFLLTWAILDSIGSRELTRRLVFTAMGAVLATLLAALIYANLTSPTSGVEQQIESIYGVEDPQFERVMGNLLGPALLPGNSVTILRNGVEIFPAMLAAIHAATKTITFETFIYWEGEVGKNFADALAARSQAGVKVHVLMDWMGSERMEPELLERMKKAGVQIEKYHPLRWYNLDRVNNRTHRKLLIVDGQVGFTGGVGIGDEWGGDATDEDHWRDNHYQVEGPVVAQMQAAFLDNWMKTHSSVMHSSEYFPILESTGTLRAQMFKSSPEGGSGSARLMFLLSIACARKSVKIANSYFVPDELAVTTLVNAARRGASVEIICPGPKIDAGTTRHASRRNWGRLLEAGVKIYEYQPTMFHCKYMIVDGLWCSVGSTNFDNRSFRLNEEANLNILDMQFAQLHEENFSQDLAKSRLITLEQWKSRPWHHKVKEWFASLVESQL